MHEEVLFSEDINFNDFPNEDSSEDDAVDNDFESSVLREEMNEEIIRQKANVSPLLNPLRMPENSRQQYA